MQLSEALAASDNVDGWLTKKEQTLLYNLAKEVPEGKAIVELGAWMGKSTIMLAAGSMAGSKVPVYAVDYFTLGNSEGHDYSVYIRDGTRDYLSSFLKNIQNAGLSSLVTPIQNSTLKAADIWTGPEPYLLFIDADHRYRAVRNDFLAWLDHCGQGARVAFHDFKWYANPGVFLFVNSLSATPILSYAGLVDSIWYGELTITEIGRSKHRLKNYPWLVNSLLNLVKRVIRKAFRLASRRNILTSIS